MLLRVFVAMASLLGPDLLSADPVRVAVVGVSHDHVFWLLHRPTEKRDIEIIAVVEADTELAAKRLGDAGIDAPVYPDVASMLAEVRPEAACLFGPIDDHHRLGMPLLEAGVHVMVEKPLALTADEARQLADQAEASGVHLLTNYETTWHRSVRELGRRTLAGDVGDPQRIVFRIGHPGPVEIGCRPAFLQWLLDPAKNGGGAVTDFGCYGANLAIWLNDGERPLSVTATTRTNKPEIYKAVDDDATIVIEFSRGTTVVQASWCWPHHVKETRVYGERGELQTIGTDGLRLRMGDAEGASAPMMELPSFEADPFTHLAMVVRGEIPPNHLSAIANNLVVMEILDAARESARTGRRVTLGPSH